MTCNNVVFIKQKQTLIFNDNLQKWIIYYYNNIVILIVVFEA